MLKKSLFALFVTAFAFSAVAGDSPQEARHELMEKVGEAAKPVGAMLKGESEYDWPTAEQSLQTFTKVSRKFGDLFPEGSDTGKTEAAPAIWEDRVGFNQALQNWRDAVAAAHEAAPGTLDDAKPVFGEVFKACKNCHDTYRIDDE